MIEPVIIGDCTLYHGDNRDVLRDLPDNSIDSVCTDPPYALVSIVKRFGKPGSAPAKGNDAYMRASAGFMGKQWDTGEVAFSEEFWAEVLRVLKPGGHVAAFGASRGYHRMACAIEDAGFEIRDSLMWIYGTGFPKSHDVSKGIDSRKDWASLERLGAAIKTARTKLGLSQTEAARRVGLIAENESLGGGGFMWFETGRMPTREEWPRIKLALVLGDEFDEAFEAAEREVIGQHKATGPGTNMRNGLGGQQDRIVGEITRPLSDAARQWEGWGTALKPAFEPIVLARKPLSEGTVAANVLKWGTGALNIDGCRVGTEVRHNAPAGNANNPDTATGPAQKGGFGMRADTSGTVAVGRWPANVVHDGSDEVVGAFPMTKNGVAVNSKRKSEIIQNEVYGKGWKHSGNDECYGVAGASESAARFFYSAKASKRDRDEGLDEFAGRNEPAHRKTRLEETGDNPYLRGVTVRKNTHPTVKPTALMQWLCRLITPPGGTVLDPFMGSGSTGKAAVWEGFNFVGCEREDEYIKIAEARIAYAVNNVPHVAAAVAAQQPANDNEPCPDAERYDRGECCGGACLTSTQADLFSGLAA